MINFESTLISFAGSSFQGGDKRKGRWQEGLGGGGRLFEIFPSKGGDYSRDGYYSRKYGMLGTSNGNEDRTS